MLSEKLINLIEDGGHEVGDVDYIIKAALEEAKERESESISLSPEELEEALRKAYFIGISPSEVLRGDRQKRVRQIYNDVCWSIQNGGLKPYDYNERCQYDASGAMICQLYFDLVRWLEVSAPRRCLNEFRNTMSLIVDSAANMDEEKRDTMLVFAAGVEMELRLADARRKGRSGWWDSSVCSMHELHQMRAKALAEHDHVSVMNFTAMIAMHESRVERLSGGQS